MGKNQKSGLGRALVKQHNQQSKENGRLQKKKVLESFTEISDIDAIIEQAEHPQPLFPTPHRAINLDLDSGMGTNGITPEEMRKLRKKEEALHASSLRVPRRPPWSADMSVEELDDNERQAFLIWRRSLARLEENEKLVLTPFEKNLDIWRQLWRVVERSDLLVMVVDSRDPLFYRCPDLEAYAQEVDEHKHTLLLVNKADLLPASVREKWVEYFRAHNILYIFWSAKAASAAVEGKMLWSPLEADDSRRNNNPDTKIYDRDELLARLQSEAEDIVQMRRNSSSSGTGPSNIQSPCENVAGSSSSDNVVVGFVGYPNVGKSSTINALVGKKRTGVTSTPGKTKHFQTLIISDKLTLCDCPGLVFPSFSSSRSEMIASGVLPIDRMTEHKEAVQVVADKVPRHVIEEIYKISLPKPKSYEPQSRPPLAFELLGAYCASRRYVTASGLPDETRAARQILKDYIDGKLPHYEMPPGMSNVELDSINLHDSVSTGTEDVDSKLAPDFEQVLDDLNSFDMANGLASNGVTINMSPASLHKKLHRKKDRYWRTENTDAEGMRVVRFPQKPLKTSQPTGVGSSRKK
ncbi:GTPase LSG1-1 isoform X1 [Cajanus cajan]|uniref:GTPase LSG1-1 isoform X1 n=1 Tax=Cajanus cajan TaxID=3821 RepID=UPI00098DAFC2|nr:GTPase LSG1-1 isoform X1 [Cajanus cajan]